MLRALLLGLAAAVPFVALALRGNEDRLSVLLGLGAVIALGLMVSSWRRFPRGLSALARHFDRVWPRFEESLELALSKPEELPPLARLQQSRVLSALGDDEPRLAASLPWAPVLRAGAWLGGALLLSALLYRLPPTPASAAGTGAPAVAGSSSPVSEPVALGLESVRVRIEPPRYMALPSRDADELNVQAPAGSRLTWQLDTRGGATAARLLFEDRSVDLAPSGEAPGRFGGQWRLGESRIYRVQIEREGREPWMSGYARLISVPDREPEVRLVAPEAMVEVSAQAPGALTVRARADDDYGINESSLVLTLATGAGEQVQFRELRLPFERRTVLTRGEAGFGVELERRLDLDTLELEPGAELFYYAEAVDNRSPEPQRARSASQRVRVPGGRGRSVALGDGIAIRPVPEVFRSQRQIIIDTEALIAERAALSRSELEFRSDAIGFDQAALRLRYGALLGEEFEDGSVVREEELAAAGGGAGHDDAAGHSDHAGHDHGHDHGPEPGASASGAPGDPEQPTTRIADLAPAEYSHMHDSGEISTFFTSEVRDKFRACLAAMWQAELYLRTARPEEALPYEEEALELLKQVQQAARVYVQRVGFEPTPLEPDRRRLTGDLSKISSHRARLEEGAPDPLDSVRRALVALNAVAEEAPPRERPSPSALAALIDDAARELARAALDDPLADVAALEAAQRLAAASRAEEALDPIRLREVRDALAARLPEPAPRPDRRETVPDALWQSYRAQLGSPP